MKILYIASSTSWGGGSVALYNLIKGLYKRHEIHVLFPYGNGRFCEELNKIGVKYSFAHYGLHIYPRCSSLKWIYRLGRTIYTNYCAKRTVKRIVEDFCPDIVHNNVGPLDISFDVCRKKNIPHIWHQREYQDKDFGMTFIPNKSYYQKRILKRGNYNIAITQGVFLHWNLRTGIDKVIYDGVFDKESLPIYIPNQRKDKYFLFVGRIEEAKGTLDAIKAFELFTPYGKDYKLLIAGKVSLNSSYYRKCKEYVENRNLNDKVLFLGERNDIYTLMSNAQALLVPSRFEGFGFITTEAMACGCLVIGRDTGGTKEQFDRGYNLTGQEIAFRFRTIEEMAEQMKKTVDCTFENMRMNAREVVLNNYTIKNHINLMEKYYNFIVEFYEKENKE